MNCITNSNNQSKNNNSNIPKNSKSNTSKSKKELNNNQENTSKTKKTKKTKEKNKSNTIIKKQKKKMIPPTWKKMEFPISQLTGKIQKNYKKCKFPKNLDKEDIEIILKLISKESKNFSAVKSNTQLTFLFILLSILSFVFGISFLIKKKYI